MNKLLMPVRSQALKCDQLSQPRSQGLSLPAPKSMSGERERPWERGCNFLRLPHAHDPINCVEMFVTQSFLPREGERIA